MTATEMVTATVLLAVTGGGRRDVEGRLQATSELADGRSATIRRAEIFGSPSENPYLGVPGISGADYDAVIEFGAERPAWLTAGRPFLEELRALWADVLDPRRTVVVVGRNHVLRAGSARFELFVAARGNASMTRTEILSGWLRAGEYNASNHPSCAGYAQLHGEPDLTESAMRALKLSSSHHVAIAREAFADRSAVAAGREYARSALAGHRGEEPSASTLLELLDRYLDFTTVSTVVTTPRGRSSGSDRASRVKKP